MFKIAVIGCGWAGAVQARLISAHPQAELVAVVDIDLAKARELGAAVGAVPFGSLASLLAAPLEFEAGCVCTPLETHFAICRSLLENGKDVFCEKPLTSSLKEADLLGRLLTKYKRDLRVNYNQRFASPIQKLKEYLSRPGTIHLVKIAMFQHPPQLEKATDYYFLITEACCHLIDTLLFLNGNIEELHAYGGMASGPILTDVTVNLKFANGSVGVLTNTFAGGLHHSQHPFHYLEVNTDQARYFVDNLYDGLWIYPHDELTRQVWVPSVFQPRSYEASLATSLEAWLNTLSGQGDSAVSFDCSRENLQIVEAITRSLETKEPVPCLW